MKKATVTGGGGFIGSAIARMLLEKGIEVSVVGRNRYPHLEALGIRTHQGDIRDRVFLEQAFEGSDTVFHVAAKAGIWGSWDEYYSINVTGSEEVIAACLASDVRGLVYTSTPSVVFRGGDLCGVNENTPYATDFLCHYAHTKMLAEKLILETNFSDLKTCALRPHLVWGPGDTNLIPRLVKRGRKGILKKVGDGRNLVDITYIDNAAEAHILAAENLESSGTAAGKAYFISQNEPVHLWNWINKFFRKINVPQVEQAISYKKAYLAGAFLEKAFKFIGSDQEPLMTRFLAEQLAKSHWFSIEKAMRDLGYMPRVTTLEGLDRTAEWVMQRPEFRSQKTEDRNQE